MVKKLALWPPLFFLLSGCATSLYETQERLRGFVEKTDYQQALELVKSNELYAKENQELLHLLEKGLILHYQGKYYQSSLILEKAKLKIELMYTVSLSRLAQSLISSDDQDLFYGQSYEHSLVFFYKALNHYLIFQQGYYEAYEEVDSSGERRVREQVNLTASQRREELFRARSELVAWNAYQNTLEDSALEHQSFQRDLLSNLLGAFIHRAIGSREDREIALGLYEAAERILFQQYSAYKTFNTSFQKFIDALDYLYSYDREQLEDGYLKKTLFFNQLYQYIQYQRLLLVFQHRGPRVFQQVVSELESQERLDTEVKKWIERDKKTLEEYGESTYFVTFLAQNGLIPPKRGREVFIGLARALEDPEISATLSFGASVLAIFAADVLGLMPPPGHYDPGAAYFGLMAAEIAIREAAIGFEVPEIEHRPISQVTEIKVWRELEDGEKDLVVHKVLPVVQPLVDIAGLSIAEGVRARRLRRTPRIVAKHIAAISASYVTYQAFRSSEGDNSVARSLALLQYVAASRAIVASERADLRYWSLLPQDIRLTSFTLAPGEYFVELIGYDTSLKSTERSTEDEYRTERLKSLSFELSEEGAISQHFLLNQLIH